MRGLEVLIAAVAAFYILGLVAGVILVYAISAIRLYRAAVQRRRQERRYREMLDRRQWYGYPPAESWDDPPPPPLEEDGGSPPRWPSL